MTGKTTEKWSARRAFERGELRAILEKIPPPGKTSEDRAALIGALAFLGRWAEAEELASSLGTLAPSDRARARFCLAVAFTRASSFRKAVQRLKEGRADAECADRPETFQAAAFYFYFLGDFRRAIRWGRRSLRAALAVGDSFIHLAALDLLAHSQMQLGRRSSGLRLFEVTAQMAAEKGYSTLALSSRLAKLRYEAEAGYRADTIVGELQEALASLAPVDTYSRANLVMELTRQLTLRGRWAEAKQLLDLEAPSIYSFQDRRQEATLQLRLGELAFRQGDLPSAMHFTRSARRCLHKVADKLYEVRVLGLEGKIQRILMDSEPPPADTARLRELSEARPSRINTQILARAGAAPEPASTSGEDLIHDLFLDLARDRGQGLRGLIDRGYLGLWPLVAGLRPGEEVLFIDDRAHVISVSARGVSRSDEAWAALPLKLLRRLARGHAGKEELIREVWGYEYEPLRHDSLIYAGLGNLRRLLGDSAAWIETSESGWNLRAGVVLREEAQPRSLSPATVSSKESTGNPYHIAPSVTVDAGRADLNFRQVKALKELEKREFWDLRTYKKVFEVSTMTAWRDLDSLMEKGFLIRLGKGRATRYVAAGRP